MPRQPTKRPLTSQSAPDATKRSRRSVHRAPLSSAECIRPSDPAPSPPSSPVRIMIFRQGQAYTPSTLDPPATSHLAEGDELNHSNPTRPSAIRRSAGPSTHPSPSVALQEARGPTFPLQQALTELQVVEHRVRFLLPSDASIVRPGATHPPNSRPPAVIPEPDPFMWANSYPINPDQLEVARNAARYYASWYPPSEIPPVDDILDTLTEARMDHWRDLKMLRSRLERVEQTLLAARREVECMLLRGTQ